jgi:hypothetical protein
MDERQWGVALPGMMSISSWLFGLRIKEKKSNLTSIYFFFIFSRIDFQGK